MSVYACRIPRRPSSIVRHIRKRAKKRSDALYRPLPPGTHGIDPSEVKRHQRARIQGALIQSVARHGYATTTITTIVDLASVSRTTFYQHFANKEDCFLQTQDMIVELGLQRVSAAYRAETDWRERLRAGFRAFMDTIVSDAAAAQLVAVEALGAGDEAIRRRDAATAAFERLFRQSFDQARDEGRVSDITIRAITGGIRRVVYLHLRDGTAAELPGYVDPLLDWALSYQQRGVDVPRKPAARPTAAAAVAPEVVPATSLRRQLGHRERILRAVISLVAAHGYRALTVPAISGAAGISNQTFYVHFKDKQEALLAAFGEAATEAVGVAGRGFASAPDWPRAVRMGLHALFTHVSNRPEFARMAMVEMAGAGPTARDRGDVAIDAFSAFLQPGQPPSPQAQVPLVVIQAITGGIWNVVYHEYAQGRLARLATLTPSLTYVALAPFLGAAEAAAVARQKT